MVRVIQWTRLDEESGKDGEILELSKLVMSGTPDEKYD